MTLVPVDPKNEASVVTLLERAAGWLSEAVHRGEAGDIAAVKAQIATAAEATKQLNLSKEIQLDAQEMVRRAEYALGKAIRRGQVEGTIRKQGDDTRVDLGVRNNLVSPYTFATKDELHANGSGIAHLAEAEPEEFEDALTEAKEEGNPSRANVVRKIKKQATQHVTRDQRAAQISDLAAKGYSSRQMPAKVGVSEETVRQIARDYGISIPADKAVSRTKRLDHTQMVEETVVGLANQAEFIDSFIDLNEVDLTEADEWVSSLTNSVRTLNRFIKQIKEKTHD